MKIFYTILLFVICLNQSAFPQNSEKSLIKNPPKLTEYVTDETGTLSKAQLDYLRLKLYYLFDTTSTQVVVYIINSLNGESIEDVSHVVATENKIGKKEFNNGVLLLIAKDDRKLRIEVGYGLEGILTDAISSQIIRNDISPYFKKGDYYYGINNGIDAIVSAVKGEYKISVGKNNENSPLKTSFTLVIGLVGSIILIIFVFWIIALFSTKTRYVGGRSTSSGSYRSYSSSGYSSSSHSSSSSSSSGFSGGGGSFGGGGASGSW